MNAGGERPIIGVHRTRDDTGVGRRSVVLPLEVPAVLGDDPAPLRSRVANDFLIFDPLVRVAGFETCQHIVSERAERLDDRSREVFVRVQPRHPPLILPRLGRDGFIDLGGVTAVVIPRGVQIVPREAGEVLDELLLGPALLPQFDECPDRDARVTDARVSADDARRLTDSLASVRRVVVDAVLPEDAFCPGPVEA